MYTIKGIKFFGDTASGEFSSELEIHVKDIPENVNLEDILSELGMVAGYVIYNGDVVGFIKDKHFCYIDDLYLR